MGPSWLPTDAILLFAKALDECIVGLEVSRLSRPWPPDLIKAGPNRLDTVVGRSLLNWDETLGVPPRTRALAFRRLNASGFD